MEAEVRMDEQGLEIIADRAWLARPALQTALGWARDKELLTEASETGRPRVRVPASEIERLGRGPACEELEAVDLWASEHEALAALLGIEGEDVLVQGQGHVGGAHLRLCLSLQGEPVEATELPERKYALRSARGEPLLASPLVLEIARVVHRFNAVAEHSRAHQLTIIARLKDLASLRSHSHSPALARRVNVQLDPHLESFTVRQPARFAAKWVDEGRNRVSLNLYAEGDREPLPLDALDGDAPLIDLQGRESVLLSQGAEAIARRARDHQRVRRERVDEEALHSPFALVEEGTELSDVDLGDYSLDDYSHRILGFEVAKRDPTTSGLSSGTTWYERDDDGQPALRVLAHAPDGKLLELTFRDGTEALELARCAETAAQRGDTKVEFGGRQVRPELRLVKDVRELVGRQHPDLAQDESESGQAGHASKSKRLRAIVADVEAGPEARERSPRDLEASVPWGSLESMLEKDVRLKPHQREGVGWLWNRYQSGASGALLADDMGLGKTLQIACFVLLTKLYPRVRAERRPTLIVAPVVLISNWAGELKRFFRPAALGRVLELRDAALRERKLGPVGLDRAELVDHDIVLISYETLARYAQSLLGISWDIVVLDEAHRIKNRGTSWSIAARGLSGLSGPERPRKFEFGVCSTGTPIENRIEDLWALYDFLSPGHPFSSYAAFCGEYGGRDDAPRALAARLQVGARTSSLLRRTKADLGRELPTKTYVTRRVAMTPAQREQEHLIARSMQTSGGFFAALQSLQKLYQHPWLLDARPIQPSSLAEASAQSPKLALCLEIVREIRARGEKALIFTLWMNMQWLLREVLQHELGLSSVHIINGAPENRTRALAHIDEFSRKEGFDVMVLSPLAAGVGLNITAANHVIHYGRWWNPAKEDQATDRAYRIGQVRPVTVYYPVLHAPDRPDAGFDVKLDELVRRKRDVARDLLAPAEGDELTQADVKALLEEVS